MKLKFVPTSYRQRTRMYVIRHTESLIERRQRAIVVDPPHLGGLFFQVIPVFRCEEQAKYHLPLGDWTVYDITDQTDMLGDTMSARHHVPYLLIEKIYSDAVEGERIYEVCKII